MTVIACLLVGVLVALLVASVVVIFALLRRLEMANRAVLDHANSVMAMASERDKAAPKMMERMMGNLADSITQTHAAIESTVKAVLTPPPVTVIDGPQVPYRMPTTQDDGQDLPMWDHTDNLLPQFDRGPIAVMGYEHETEPGFDPENPFGIPGMKSVTPEVV